MPNKRNIYKHLIIFDKDKTTILSDVYLTTYPDIYTYILKNFPSYECPVHVLQDFVNNRPISVKYHHIVSLIQITNVSKNQIPKHSIIISNHH